ncbi:MAG: hypothetical protein U5L11_01030 [Arhodomonas sp.]|nr:hypothetical protein [Arhodomonas sp.]
MFWAVAVVALWNCRGLIPEGVEPPRTRRRGQGQVLTDCRVTKVYDGDTLTTVCAGQR